MRKPRRPTGDNGEGPKAVAPAKTVTEPVGSEVDVAYEQLLKPAEERRYSISIEGTYADLLDAVSRMSGLAILGDIPNGNVTYVSTEEMDFDAAVSRLRKILFNHPENFYIRREGNALHVFRMTEATRLMPLDFIYTSIEDFLSASLDEMEVVLVLYSPGFPAEELEGLRDFMPDYVRIAPYPGKNAVTILALTRDVHKYTELVQIFKGAGEDPRAKKFLPVRHMLPSAAMQMLYELVPSAARSRSPPKAWRGSRGPASTWCPSTIARNFSFGPCPRRSPRSRSTWPSSTWPTDRGTIRSSSPWSTGASSS